MGKGLAALSDFHFRDLEMTPQRSSKVKVFADSESLLPFLLVSLSNYGSISHRLGATGNYNFM